jgi:hypothetical protein
VLPGLEGLDWGNVPSWVGSVLTGSSLLIAAFSYRHSISERTREQADRERGQAMKVSAWVVNSRQACVRNGNDVAVMIRAFVTQTSDAAAQEVSFAPGQTRRLSLPAIYERVAVERGQLALMPWLLIVDSAGRSWLRANEGSLENLSPDERADLERRLDGAATNLELTID